MSELFFDSFNDEKLFFKYLHNPSHLAGIGDLIDSTEQKYDFGKKAVNKVGDTVGADGVGVEKVKNVATGTVEGVQNFPKTVKSKITDTFESKKKEAQEAVERKIEETQEAMERKVEEQIEEELNKMCAVEAAYASEVGDDLDVLREFRDDVLDESKVGSWFVRKYYKHSPLVAEYLTEHSGAQNVVRELFIEPTVSLIKKNSL